MIFNIYLQITGVRKHVVEEHKVLEECVTWRKYSDGLGMHCMLKFMCGW